MMRDDVLAPQFSPVIQDSLRERVTVSIQDAILAGRLKPGDKIVEVDLARQMAISRAPIREAVRELIAQGLLVASPRKGTSVADWSVANLVEAYTVRAVLEEMAARLAAQRGTPDDFDRMEEIVRRMRKAADAGDKVELARQDLAFHRAILEVANHGHLVRVWSGLGVLALMLLSVSRVDKPSTHESDQHQRVVDMLRSRDSERAGRALRDTIVEGVLDACGLSEAELERQVGAALVAELHLSAPMGRVPSTADGE